MCVYCSDRPKWFHAELAVGRLSLTQPNQPTDIQSQPKRTHDITHINPTQPASHKITKTTSMVDE